jgi:hypothetical protein
MNKIVMAIAASQPLFALAQSRARRIVLALRAMIGSLFSQRRRSGYLWSVFVHDDERSLGSHICATTLKDQAACVVSKLGKAGLSA